MKQSRQESSQNIGLVPVKWREASVKDIKGLVILENRCFDTDALNARNFHWLITKGHAELKIAESAAGQIMGYILILFNRRTSLARIYSLAIDPDYRQLGIATKLITQAEKLARERLVTFIRLEVRQDNFSAIKLYESLNYYRFGELSDYYADHSSALRYEKKLFTPTNAKFSTAYYCVCTKHRYS